MMPSHLRNILDLRKLVNMSLLVGSSLRLNGRVSFCLEDLAKVFEANEKRVDVSLLTILLFIVVSASV